MPRSDAEINVSVTFRHTESTPALKTYATEKVTNALRKFVQRSAEVDIVLSIEKRDHSAEAKVHSKGYDVSAKAVTEDLYSAIDKVVDALETQLRRQKDKNVSRKQ